VTISTKIDIVGTSEIRNKTTILEGVQFGFCGILTANLTVGRLIETK